MRLCPLCFSTMGALGTPWARSVTASPTGFLGQQTKSKPCLSCFALFVVLKSLATLYFPNFIPDAVADQSGTEKYRADDAERRRYVENYAGKDADLDEYDQNSNPADNEKHPSENGKHQTEISHRSLSRSVTAPVADPGLLRRTATMQHPSLRRKETAKSPTGMTAISPARAHSTCFLMSSFRSAVTRLPQYQ